VLQRAERIQQEAQKRISALASSSKLLKPEKRSRRLAI